MSEHKHCFKRDKDGDYIYDDKQVISFVCSCHAQVLMTDRVMLDMLTDPWWSVNGHQALVHTTKYN